MNRVGRALRQPVLWAWVGAVLLAALYGRVALLHLTGGVVGGDLDGYENLWNNWWVKTALIDPARLQPFALPPPDLHAMGLFYTDYLYYPTGISLRFHTLNPANGLLTLPFNLLFGFIPTTNLLFLTALTLTTGFTFLLIRDWLGDARVAFVGAALFTYASRNVLAFYTLGQAEKLSVEWLPLYLFLLFRALADLLPASDPGSGPPRRAHWPWYAAGAVGALLIMSLTDWQYVIYAVFTTLLLFAYLALTQRNGLTLRRIFGRLATIGGAYALLVGPPLLLPMLAEAAGSPWLAVGYQSSTRALDLGDLLGPGLGNPGYLVLALALGGVFTARGAWRSRAGFWALAVGLFYLLALGPSLTFAGHATGFPLPYALLQNLPVFNIGRDPGRYSTIALLGVAHLAALGLTAVGRGRWAVGGGRWAVGGGPWAVGSRQLRTQNAERRTPSSFRIPHSAFRIPLYVLVLLVSLTPFVVAAGEAKVDAPDWPPFYEQVARDPEPYAILQLPAFTDKGRGENHYMLYQTLTGKPIFGGRWARDHKLSNPNNFMQTASLFHHFLLLGFAPDQLAYSYPARDFLQRTDYVTQGRAILNYYHVRYIVVWQEALDAEWNAAEFARVIGQVLGPDVQPSYEDRLMRVYRVPDGPPVTNPLTLDVGDGWFAAARGPTGQPYRWADPTSGEPADLFTMNLTQAPQPATLTFTAYPFGPARSLHISLDAGEVATVALTPEAGAQPFRVQLTVPPGNHRIRFSSSEPPRPTGDPRDPRLLSFGMYGVALTAR
ncbi:MAG: hypothetical protein M3Z04_22560 [Chloroflexota bacterium]|nr:hypothetical protein [Chloroflexota bacterium]